MGHDPPHHGVPPPPAIPLFAPLPRQAGPQPRLRRPLQLRRDVFHPATPVWTGAEADLHCRPAAASLLHAILDAIARRLWAMPAAARLTLLPRSMASSMA